MARKKYDNRKVNVVGNFFEELTQALIVSERAPHAEGDFHIWDKGLGIEVKSSDANHEFRLPLRQLDLYRKLSGGFPFNHFLFFLFSYHNDYIKENGGKITSLSKHDEPTEIRDFLARHLKTLFIIDMAVVDFLFMNCRISDKSIPLHPGVQSLNIRPGYLQRLADGGWQAITDRAHNLQAKSLVCSFSFVPDMLEDHRLIFRVNLIGRSPGIRQILSSFRPIVRLT